MRNFGKRVLSGMCALVMISTLLCTPASARSSAYLDGYRAAITPDPGGILVITVDVTGVGYMPEIGAKTIYLYESRDNKNFTRIETFESSKYPQMMGSGTFFYEDVITYQGTVGYYYYAKVFVYAGNNTGGDERSYTTSVKQAKRT